jgi:hypothetical protein
MLSFLFNRITFGLKNLIYFVLSKCGYIRSRVVEVWDCSERNGFRLKHTSAQILTGHKRCFVVGNVEIIALQEDAGGEGWISPCPQVYINVPKNSSGIVFVDSSIKRLRRILDFAEKNSTCQKKKKKWKIH